MVDGLPGPKESRLSISKVCRSAFRVPSECLRVPSMSAVRFLSERRGNVCVALFEEMIEESLEAFVEVACERPKRSCVGR